MSFDPWNGRRAVSIGGTSSGDAPIFVTLPAAGRRPAPALRVPLHRARTTEVPAPPRELAYTIGGAAPRDPDRSGWIARWTPRGAPAAAAAPPLPRAAPTLSRGPGSIPHDLTATWDATRGGKPTTIAP
jgi:hypothetical protein